IAKSNVNLSNDIKLIKYKIKNNKDKIDLVFSDNESSFKVYNINSAIKNAIYIPIESKEYIYPPDWRKNLDFYKLYYLLNIEHIFSSKYISKCGKDLVLLINII
ncbi:fructosamine kinase family protein, partial [Clostridium perfringens]